MDGMESRREGTPSQNAGVDPTEEGEEGRGKCAK